MSNPLPAIALLPLALLWFGLGTTSIVIGLIVENFVFRLIEKKTVRRWGMQG